MEQFISLDFVAKFIAKIKDYAFKLTGEELTEEEKRSINI